MNQNRYKQSFALFFIAMSMLTTESRAGDLAVSNLVLDQKNQVICNSPSGPALFFFRGDVTNSGPTAIQARVSTQYSCVYAATQTPYIDGASNSALITIASGGKYTTENGGGWSAQYDVDCRVKVCAAPADGSSAQTCAEDGTVYIRYVQPDGSCTIALQPVKRKGKR